MAHPMIKCSACDGHGERAMSDELYEVFALVGFQDWISTSEVVHRLNKRPAHVKVKGSAIANRFVKLLGLGLVESRRAGTSKEWRRI